MGKQYGNDCKGGEDCVDEKHLCKVLKQKNLAKLKELARDAQYICKKCGRAAHNAVNLCKPDDFWLCILEPEVCSNPTQPNNTNWHPCVCFL